jgi:CheY-like chemotaxis protein
VKSPHALLIDDDDLLRRSLRAWLEESGYRVTEAGDGTDATTLQERDPVDVLICDILMPHKEGLETIREFHAMFPSVRIIAISGAPMPGGQIYLKLASQFGAAAVLLKPFTRQDLANALTA